MVDATTTRAGTMEDRLLTEFPAPSLEQWREEVVRLLKGAPFDKKMLTSTHEGITLQPMYTAEDVKDLPFQDSFPGQWPYLRGTEPLGKRLTGWQVCQELKFADAKSLNAALRTDLERGQTAINFHLDEAGQRGLDADQAESAWVGLDGTSLSTFEDASQILDGLSLDIPMAIVGAEGSVPAAALMVSALKAKGADLKKSELYMGFDPLGVLACKGSLPMKVEQAFDELADLTKWAKENAPKARTLVACGHPYHEAGGNAVQELAFTLASALATLRALERRGVSVEDAASRMLFRVGVGGQFFMEIAKLRALRVLWAQVVRACGGSDEACKLRVFAKSGHFNKTQFDQHVNILRSTTEAFAAVVAGVDMLHVGAFDEVLGGESSDLGRRVARNTQIMLKEESRLDQVVDLSGGSWTVETLTSQLVTAAWALFQGVEAQGGFQMALETGYVQSRILEVADARRKAVSARTETIVGVNQYSNALEGMPEVKTLDHASLKSSLGAKSSAARKGSISGRTFAELLNAAPNATLNQLTQALGRQAGPKIQSLQMMRAAEGFETLRTRVLAFRQGKATPQIFMANLGPVGAYMPRLDFTRGFFQVGGFQVEDQQSFNSAQEATQAALQSGAPIVVVVGLDDTYIAQVPELAAALKKGGVKTVLVAGLLKEQADAFKAAGVDDFIHIKSDVLAVLSGLAERLGVC